MSKKMFILLVLACFNFARANEPTNEPTNENYVLSDKNEKVQFYKMWGFYCEI